MKNDIEIAFAYFVKVCALCDVEYNFQVDEGAYHIVLLRCVFEYTGNRFKDRELIMLTQM